MSDSKMIVPDESLGPAPGHARGPELVCLEGLTVAFRGRRHSWRRVVDGVGLGLAAGEVVAVIGESGSGKTTVCRAMIGLIGGPSRVDGSLYAQLGGGPRRRMRSLRECLGREVGYMPQDALQSLNPSMTVGAQLAEVLVRVGHLKRRERAARVTEALRGVGLEDVERVRRSYPHQLSGGMRQRVVLAAALAGDPQVLIADEPTTAVDATLRYHLLRMLGTLCDDRGLAVLIVTHDMSVAEMIADRLVVMYGGRVVETGPAERVLVSPLHPYSQALVSAALLQGKRGMLETARGENANGMTECGCPFASRCPTVRPRCREKMPPWTSYGGVEVRCWAHVGGDRW